MKKYEILYIVSSQFTDNEIEEVTKRVAAILAKHGAEIFKQENLGKIKLAYPINRMRHGTYILAYFNAEPETLKKINSELGLSGEALRHQIIVMPDSAEERTYEIQSYVPPLSEEGKTASSRSDIVKKKKLMPPAPAKKDDVAPMSVEELDKKLDEILEGDISKV